LVTTFYKKVLKTKIVMMMCTIKTSVKLLWIIGTLGLLVACVAVEENDPRLKAHEEAMKKGKERTHWINAVDKNSVTEPAASEELKEEKSTINNANQQNQTINTKNKNNVTPKDNQDSINLPNSGISPGKTQPNNTSIKGKTETERIQNNTKDRLNKAQNNLRENSKQSQNNLKEKVKDGQTNIQKSVDSIQTKLKLNKQKNPKVNSMPNKNNFKPLKQKNLKDSLNHN